MNPNGKMPPVPPGFPDRFVKDGWRACERLYHAGTPVLVKWIEMSGGPVLIAKRAAAQTCGRRAGGPPVNPVRPEV